MATREDTGYRDVWGWALSWFRKPPTCARKRLRQAALVAVLKAELDGIPDVPGLHERYVQEGWARRLAREHFPTDWPLLGLHACKAVAFALRYVEIVTGKPVRVHALPAWLGEWAVY